MLFLSIPVCRAVGAGCGRQGGFGLLPWKARRLHLQGENKSNQPRPNVAIASGSMPNADFKKQIFFFFQGFLKTWEGALKGEHAQGGIKTQE